MVNVADDGGGNGLIVYDNDTESDVKVGGVYNEPNYTPPGAIPEPAQAPVFGTPEYTEWFYKKITPI
jgi:hypothetical protein